MTNKERYLFLIAVLLFAVAPLQHISGQTSSGDLGLNTIVIDPGHGGKDPGAPGKTKATAEKHIVLNISKLFGQKIKDAYPDVKVVYTRSTDVFVELKERANIAKKNNADLKPIDPVFMLKVLFLQRSRNGEGDILHRIHKSGLQYVQIGSDKEVSFRLDYKLNNG